MLILSQLHSKQNWLDYTANSCLTVMLWEDKDLEVECVQSQDRTVIYWLATRTRKKESKMQLVGKKKRRRSSFKEAS